MRADEKYFSRKNVKGPVEKRTTITIWPDKWPECFWKSPGPNVSPTCSDVKTQPCDECDGKKCWLDDAYWNID